MALLHRKSKTIIIMYVMKERQKRRFFDDVESSREKISFFIVYSCGFVLVVSSSVLFCFVLIVFLFL